MNRKTSKNKNENWCRNKKSVSTAFWVLFKCAVCCMFSSDIKPQRIHNRSMKKRKVKSEGCFISEKLDWKWDCCTRLHMIHISYKYIAWNIHEHDRNGECIKCINDKGVNQCAPCYVLHLIRTFHTNIDFYTGFDFDVVYIDGRYRMEDHHSVLDIN